MMQPLLAMLALVVQDEPAEMKWASLKDDFFEMKWSFEEKRLVEAGTNNRTEFFDKRSVDAELTALEEPGQYLVTLKKVVWNQSTEVQDVTVTWAGAGKPATSSVKVKPPTGSTPAVAAELRKSAESTGESLKKVISDGEHKLVYDPVQKLARFSRNGMMTRNSLVLDRVFLHTMLPNGTVNNGQSWKEELDRAGLPSELEVKSVNPKISFSGPNLTMKIGVEQPINIAGADTTGKITLAREFSFSRDFHLTSSKEEISYLKKVDPKGKDAFYKNTFSQSVKQSLTIKKIVPKEEKPK